ncbi:MAG: helix-turn-helix transcriptional regulator [candidate division Zixibacteria bacterium]|nr:helix-turn-helix transcriptional regulator [Phycisphaerae bacterium]NIP51773.1 helix-turn-helix transcriptional regulator [Phycisphaerae bacterium]NIS15462.1 helix-turn-helix transcriptional regulator [candidate division Zixibacteria bacterium]NIX27791.1 helix-turn-helix domain-containing protein [Phycisphaerae bacterium]
MARSADAPVNPDLLVWARRNSSLTIEQVAKKVSVKPERLKQWEKGELMPTIKQLSKLGHIYKRPIAIFYRPMSSIPNPHRHGMLPRRSHLVRADRTCISSRSCTREYPPSRFRVKPQ